MNIEPTLIEAETIELISVGGKRRRPPPPSLRMRFERWVEGHVWYLALVVAPTLAAAVYFGLIAADRYVSHAQFVVRSPSTAATSQLTSLVQGSSVVRSSDDAYITHAYIRSRDATRKLAADHALLSYLTRPEADVVWWYPGLLRSDSGERLWRHFQSLVDLDYDSTTGITTLSVQAFRPEDARAIAEALLVESEALINGLSERAHTEAIEMASREVDVTRERARQALERITEFRRRTAMIDPGRVSQAALETITRLALEVANTNAELTELRRTSPDSPQANALKTRIAALEAQIQKERVALAGTDGSLAPLIAEYERLMLEREFAERSFASAQAALDLARVEADRQRLFLERISAPALPDYPERPWRLLGIVAVFALAQLTYAIGRRLLDDTRAHAGN